MTRGQFCVEKRIDSLPALDATKTRLFDVFQDEDADIDKVEGVICTDPAITAKVVKLANSPFYRHTQQHLCLHQSLLTVGLDMVKCISLSMDVMGALRCETRHARDLWSHSYAVAVATLAVSRNRAEKDRLFTGALLHDLGRMVFLAIAPETYAALIDSEGGRPSEELELERFSVTHTALGEMVAKRWNFPREIVEIIGAHHRPVSRESALVYLINHVVCRHEAGIPEADPASAEITRPFLGDAYKELVRTITERYTKNTAMIEGLF